MAARKTGKPRTQKPVRSSRPSTQTVATEAGQQQGTEDRYVTTGQAAKACGVSDTTVRSWCERGYLVTRKFPSGHRRIQVASIQKLCADMGKVPAGLS